MPLAANDTSRYRSIPMRPAIVLRMREWKTSPYEVKTAERVDNHRRSCIIEHNLRGALLSGGLNPVILRPRERERVTELHLAMRKVARLSRAFD